ncbi:hypothetical protein D3C72_693330 [compost metagenome]
MLIHTGFAQVGVTTNTPDKSAALDMKAMSDKGILLPNVNITKVSDPAPVLGNAPVQGLWIYNNNTAVIGTYLGISTKGFYYWQQNRWNKMATPLDTTGWGRLGNIETNPSIHFIGTRDAADWVVKTNNTERMRVTAAGNVGIGTSNPTNQLHVKAASVRFENLELTTNDTDAGLVVDNMGVVKLSIWGSAYFQSSDVQDLPSSAFSAISNPAIIDFSSSDMLLNTIGTWNDSDNTFNVFFSGTYEITAEANFYVQTVSDETMGISLVLQKWNGTAWVNVIGNRDQYEVNWSGKISGVYLTGVLALNDNTKLRLVIQRTEGGTASGNIKIMSDQSTGIQYSKFFRIIKVS